MYITISVFWPQNILPAIQTETDLQRVSEATVSGSGGNTLTLAFLPVVSCYPFSTDWDCNPLPMDWYLHHRIVTLELATWQHAGKFKD